jgi:hypothetical protein
MVITAVEQLRLPDKRIVTDPLAIHFLTPTLATLIRACRWDWWLKRLVDATEARG